MSNTTNPGERGRCSAPRKAANVLRLLRGESLELLRLMREHGLLAPQRVGHPHGPKAHDGTIITDRPDEMWGTDMTTTVTTEEGHVCVFVAVDHCTNLLWVRHFATVAELLEALREFKRRYTALSGYSVAVRNELWPVYLWPSRADISVRARS
jgi:hypothetical protein